MNHGAYGTMRRPSVCRLAVYDAHRGWNGERVDPPTI